jgi:hypothetical protein
VEGIEEEPPARNTKILPLRYNLDVLSFHHSGIGNQDSCTATFFRFKNDLLETGSSKVILSSDIFVLFLVKGTTFKIFVVSFWIFCMYDIRFQIAEPHVAFLNSSFKTLLYIKH